MASFFNTDAVMREYGIVTKALSWVRYWYSSPARFAKQILLVPTSRPIAVPLFLSFDFITYLLPRALGFDRCGYLSISLLQTGFIFRRRRSGRERLAPHLVFGQQQPLPDATSGDLHGTVVVPEPEREQAGGRRGVSVRQGPFREPANCTPIDSRCQPHFLR